MVNRIEKHFLLTLILVCAGLYFFYLKPASIMEARNFIVAREMVTDGNWLLTTMNGEPRYEKPPLPAWVTSPFLAVFGTDDILWYRVPTSIVASLGIILLYFFVRDETGHRQLAGFAALILATSFYYVFIRFEAPSDVYAHVFMFAAVCALHKFWKADQVRTGLLAAAALLTGLSILSKGPVSLYAILLPFLISWFAVYRAPLWKQKLAVQVFYVLIALVVGGSWYAYIRIVDPAAVTETLSQETSRWGSYHARPIYYYWSFFAESGVWAVPALIGLFLFPRLKKQTRFPQLYQFSFLWVLLTVVLLSLIPEKKSRYIMPVLIPLAILTAITLRYFIAERRQHPGNLKKAVDYLVFGLPGVVAILAPASYFLLDIDTPGRWVWYGLTSLLFVATGAFILLQVRRGQLEQGFYAIIGLHLLIAVIGLRATGMIPKSPGFRPVTSFRNPQHLPVYALGELTPQIIWEMGEKIPALTSRHLQETNRLYVLTDPDEAGMLAEMVGAEREITKADWFDRNELNSRGRKGYRGGFAKDIYLVNPKSRWAKAGKADRKPTFVQ